MASERLTESKELHPPAGGARVGGGRGFGVQTVYEALKRDIIEMTLAPGEPLDETRLSRRFAMSRTPVREAMVRLAAEGLVTTLPNRNTIVAPIDFASVPVYFDALVLMYRVTTRLAALHRKESDLIEIRALGDAFARTVEAADAFGMIAVNRDFHIAIARAGRNRYYTEFFAKLLDEGRRLLRLYYSSYNDHLPRHMVHEHDDIIAAVADRDPERADRIAGNHATQVVRQIQNFLGEGGIAGDMNLGALTEATGGTNR
ncbi:MAG TPA: GntR family transcriptional regulator [Bauldia sp.]|nr:GntR family transcriptional regulator [Bauldia sp.]